MKRIITLLAFLFATSAVGQGTFQGVNAPTRDATTGQQIQGFKYQPTATAGTNASSITTYSSLCTRVGSIVSCSGVITVTCGAASGACLLAISLPIPSNLTSSLDARGVANATTGAASGGIGHVLADDVNDKAYISVTNGSSTSSRDYAYTFHYEIK